MAVSPTTTQVAEPQNVEVTANNAAAAPKKRRRRAPATGATEDCFSCKKRQIKCDRRRPYCGQCVEIGKECSGYRTTLTWGVGVASRGKLRGMSLPIAKSPPAAAQQGTKISSTRNNSVASTSTTSTTTTTQHNTGNYSTRSSIDFGVHSPTSPTSPGMYSAPQEYQYFSATSPIPIPSPSTPMGFPMIHHNEHFDFLHPQSKLGRPNMQRGPLQRLQTSLHTPYEDNGMSASSASLGTYSDSDFPSPSDYPHTPVDEFPFADPSIPRYSSAQSHDQPPFGSLDSFFLNEPPRSLPMADDMSSSVSSDQSIQDYIEVSSAQQSMGPPAFPDIYAEGEMNSSFNGFSPGFSFLPSEESCNRYAPFPTDVIPSGLLRQIYMPGSGGF